MARRLVTEIAVTNATSAERRRSDTRSPLLPTCLNAMMDREQHRHAGLKVLEMPKKKITEKAETHYHKDGAEYNSSYFPIIALNENSA